MSQLEIRMFAPFVEAHRLALAVGSTCVWKRRKEAVDLGYLRANEKLVEGTREVNGKTLKTWRIVRV
jgi:hypothetical protein